MTIQILDKGKSGEGLYSSVVTFANLRSTMAYSCSSDILIQCRFNSDTVYGVFFQQGPQGFTGPPGEPGEAGSAVSILHLQNNNTKQKNIHVDPR